MQNNVYQQRNTLAVALAWMTLKSGGRAGRGFDQAIADRGDEPGWGHVLYIDVKGEQISYHFAPGDDKLLDGLPEYAGEWDGNFTGRTSEWLELLKPAPDECAELVAKSRLSPVSLRRWYLEKGKLEADKTVTPETAAALLLGYARRWS